MGWSNPNFPVAQVAITFQGHSGNVFRKEGDIAGMRIDEINGFGLRTVKPYIWMRLTGLEENELFNLAIPNTEGIEEGIIFNKYRYSTPITKIIEKFPDFDLSFARDINMIYQPFINLDERNHIITWKHEPFDVRGFVWDKQFETFL